MNLDTPTYILIDGSYFCFYRYHSLLTWWKNAFPQEPIENPIEDPIFMAKFKKTFLEKVTTLQKKINIDERITPTILVGKDCKREFIWRNQLFPKYKGTRDYKDFKGGPVFKKAYEDDYFIQGGAHQILKYDTLEADDCIAITVKYILKHQPNSKIYIITSDKDYLQLAEDRVEIYNLAYKKLTEQKSCTGNSQLDLFCKILTGDPSDNIPSIWPKLGQKTAFKMYTDEESFLKKLNSNIEYVKQYNLNRTIIDFNAIPLELVEGFIEANQLTIRIH